MRRHPAGLLNGNCHVIFIEQSLVEALRRSRVGIRPLVCWFSDVKSREEIQREIEKDPLLKEILESALRNQHRYAKKPVFGSTGKGYLKSEGVEELAGIKEELKQENKAAVVKG